MAYRERLGRDAKLYYNPTGISGDSGYSAGAWALLTNIKDATVVHDKSKTDTSTRASGKYQKQRGVSLNVSIEFKMKNVPGDAAVAAFRTKWFSGDIMGIAVLDGPDGTPAPDGVQGQFEVMKFTRNESNTDIQWLDVSLEPTGDQELTAITEAPI